MGNSNISLMLVSFPTSPLSTEARAASVQGVTLPRRVLVADFQLSPGSRSRKSVR